MKRNIKHERIDLARSIAKELERLIHMLPENCNFSLADDLLTARMCTLTAVDKMQKNQLVKK